jgi:hypothetical protein
MKKDFRSPDSKTEISGEFLKKDFCGGFSRLREFFLELSPIQKPIRRESPEEFRF